MKLFKLQKQMYDAMRAEAKKASTGQLRYALKTCAELPTGTFPGLLGDFSPLFKRVLWAELDSRSSEKSRLASFRRKINRR